MALSEDSRTLLQLLLGRGKSYGDIAGLLGIDEGEVRDRAHRALTEINGGDPDRDVNLTDYLLGQSDPIGRADTARELASNPEATETAAALSDQLRLLVPGAELPRIAGAAQPSASKPKRAARPTRTREPREPKAAAGPLSTSQRRLVAVLLLAALLVTVLILVLTGAIGGSDDDDPPQAADPESAIALMQPVGDQQGSGRVQLGQADDQFAARLSFDELEPTSKNESYVLWTVGSIGAFPLNESAVGEDGQISQTILVPPVVFCAIATDAFPEMRLSRLSGADRQTVLTETNRAVKGNLNKLPSYSGKTVFEGPITIAQSLKDNLASSCAAPQTGGNANQSAE